MYQNKDPTKKALKELSNNDIDLSVKSVTDKFSKMVIKFLCVTPKISFLA